ncbi:MAG: DUF1501 domain-containing protein [Bacteroidia bacterium]|nr:DUF1501 domain-containing protein [Bacteroidia bacterium]
MNRRDFIKHIAPLAVVPFFSNRLFAAIPELTKEQYTLLTNALISDDRILVVIQMTGGNDGLNMVLPLDQYTNLAAARANILIPDTAALTLGSHPTGLHPAMTGLKNLYDDDKLTVVQNVGYNNFSLSHFRAMDIFASGSDSNQTIDSGWLGRYIEYYYPGFPAAYPNTNTPDPLAISIGSSVFQALQGFSQNTAQQIPTSFTGSLTQLLGYSNTTVPATPAGLEVEFIRLQQGFANAYASQIVNAWNAGANSSTVYPPSPAGLNNNLAQQLRIIARLIKGGLNTKIYFASLGSFDTHASQTDLVDHTIGFHANLLKELSDSIFAFQSDLALLGLDNRVLGMTNTEFGRRIKSNAGTGTDHGTVSPIFLFGNYVNPTVIGPNPVIPVNVQNNTQLPVQIDYREIYMSVLQNWFCLSPTEAGNVLLHNQVPLNSVIAPCGPLPVELMSFRAEKFNTQDALLSWATASEQSSDSFEVERSTDGKDYIFRGKVAAAGHSHDLLSYTFTDKNLPVGDYQTFYYRLKLKDIDGEFAYSEVRKLLFSADTIELEVTIFPNPSTDGTCQIHLNQDLPQSSDSEILLQDIMGRVIAEETMYLDTSPKTLDFGQKIASGTYYLVVKNDLGSKVVRWVIL